MKTRIDSTFAVDYFDLRSAVYILEPNVISDNRGYFFESFNENDCDGMFPTRRYWCRQINVSSSVKNVIRGLHAQSGSHCQGKLVQCLHGSIVDIIVDMRKDMATFGTWKAYRLSDSNNMMLWVPRGFLHGFYTEKQSVFQYFVDNSYCKKSEISVSPLSFFNNESVRSSFVDFGFGKMMKRIESGDVIFSEKDQNGCDFETFKCKLKKNWYK